jgi:hypothetical protein
MANEFKVKKGLIVDGSNTVLDIQGTQGQLFSVTDSLTGDLFSVSDVSGIPILNVNSSGIVTIDGNIQLADNDKIQLGNSQDLELYHDGTHSYISDNGTGELRFIANGATRFKIGSDVASFSGTDFAIAAARKLYLDGQSNTYITESSSDTIKFFTGGTEVLQLANNAATFTGIVGVGMAPDSAVALTVSGQIGPTNGTAAAPTHTFYSDDDTGMYRSAANALSFSTSGTLALTLDSSQNATFAGTGTFKGGGNTLTLKKGTGTAALAFAGASSTPEASALIEGVAGGGLKIYTSTSSAGTIADPGWSSKLTIAQNGNATFTGTVNVDSDFKVRGSSGEDHFVIAPQAAGTGTYLISYNGAETGYEPLRIDAESYNFTNAGTSVISTSGLDTTFAGDVTLDNILLTTATLPAVNTPSISLRSTNNEIYFQAGSANVFNFMKADYGSILTLNGSTDATFAGNVTIGDNSASEIFLAFNSSATDFALGANGSNFMIGTSSDLDSGNLITLSGTNGRLGIGTTSPSTALQVGGLDDGSNYDITVGWNAVSSQAVGTKRSALTFKTSQTAVNNEDIYKWDIAMVTAPATASNEPFGSNLAFLRSTRSSTSVDETTMILTQLGNVGIGTDSPASKFEVYGGSSGVNDVDRYVRFKASNGEKRFDFYVGGTGNASNLGMYTSDGTTKNVQISAGGTSYLNAGNVGIGTTTPDSKLEVDMNDASGNRLGFIGDGSTTGAALWTNWTTGASYLDFRLGGTTNTYTKMSITSAGNVGINCTPSYKLQWSDGTRTGLLDTNIGAVVIGSVSNDALALYTNLTEKMRITSAGNVGIGTTSPSSNLQVSGDAYVTEQFGQGVTIANKLTNYGAEFRTSGASAQIFFGRSGNSVGTGAIGADSTYVMRVWKSDFSQPFVIKQSGEVGIGTTSPGTLHSASYGFTRLHIDGGTDRGQMIIEGDSFAGIVLSDNGATANQRVFVTSVDETKYTIKPLNDNGTSTVGGVAFTVLHGGNVGIGTTNPTNKLHIQGSQTTVYSPTDSGGQASAGTTINNTNTAGNTNNFSQLLFTVGTNNNSVSRIVAIRSGSDASDLAFVGKSTAGVAEYMRIKSGGNVGIGIDNPSALLEVRKGTISGQIAKFSAINPHVVIESSTAGNAVLHLKPNVTGSKSGQFKVTAGNGYNFRWSNDASGTGEIAYMDLDTSTTGGGDLTVKGDVIAYGSPSDKKYKENIKPIESALDKAMQLQGVTFDWKDSESILEIKEDIGFIAQDVQEVLPELVRDNGKGNLSLRYQGITPILLEAIKELKAEIEELKLNNCNCNK